MKEHRKSSGWSSHGTFWEARTKTIVVKHKKLVTDQPYSREQTGIPYTRYSSPEPDRPQNINHGGHSAALEIPVIKPFRVPSVIELTVYAQPQNRY